MGTSLACHRGPLSHLHRSGIETSAGAHAGIRALYRPSAALHPLAPLECRSASPDLVAGNLGVLLRGARDMRCCELHPDIFLLIPLPGPHSGRRFAAELETAER